MRHIVLLHCVLVLGGCAHELAYGHKPVDPEDAEAVHAFAQVNPDQFSGMKWIRGPVVSPDGYMRVKAYQVVAGSQSGRPADQWEYAVAFMVENSRYLYLSQAYANGREYKTHVFDRKPYACVPKQGCTYQEKVNVGLTSDEWRQAARAGLSVKLWGKRGEVIYHMPAA